MRGPHCSFDEVSSRKPKAIESDCATAVMCAHDGCRTLLIYADNGCRDCGDTFFPPGCTCDTPVMLCSDHHDGYVCEECQEQERAEDVPKLKKKTKL